MQNLHSCEKKTKSSSGFTLVELLVVCTILAIVISAIAACLAGGIRVWDSARSFHVGESDTMLAMEYMRRDLGATFSFPGIPLTVKQREMSFPGIVHEDPEGKGKLGTIAYAFRSSDGALERRTAVYPDGQPRIEVLLSDAREVSFQAGFAQNMDSLVSTGLPARVDIEIVIIEYDTPMTLTRNVALPAGGG